MGFPMVLTMVSPGPPHLPIFPNSAFPGREVLAAAEVYKIMAAAEALATDLWTATRRRRDGPVGGAVKIGKNDRIMVKECVYIYIYIYIYSIVCIYIYIYSIVCIYSIV